MKHKNCMKQFPRFIIMVGCIMVVILLLFSQAAVVRANQLAAATAVPDNQYFTSITKTLANGKSVDVYIINGPPNPPAGYEVQRSPVALPDPEVQMAARSLTVPAYNWVFGCSAVSGGMIAAYYDRNGYDNMYTGPTNGGVMPLDNSTWGTWSDGVATYPNIPLSASHNGVDGRAILGSIDDYWVQYGSSANDPYITGAWTQHTWGNAIGDYMKTSQSAYGNTDGSTNFYNYTSSATPLTCADMLTYGVNTLDGTYGRKLFYEARGYTVTDCYSQKTDNTIAGGFSFAQLKAEIDAGRPVMLNLAGHTVVGVGYDDTGNTVYIHDTWDYLTHNMTWGTSYSGMQLLSVSIVNLTPLGSNNPVPTTTSLNPTSATAGGIAYTLTVNGTNFVNGSTVRWNGTDRTTTYVNSTQLTASILAADIATAGTASVTVFTGTPGGGTSNAQTFTINNPVPTTTSLNPTSATAGGIALP